MKEEIGACPNCKGEHTFLRRQDKMNWPSDRLFICKKFKERREERGTLLEKLKACSRCTSWRHLSRAAQVSQPSVLQTSLMGQSVVEITASLCMIVVWLTVV